jgi:NitT/TauT family transport system substrate-binding protein
MTRSRTGSTAGILITMVLIAGLVGLGTWMLLREAPAPAAVATPGTTPAADEGAPTRPEGTAPAPIEPAQGAPRLAAAAPYAPRNGVVSIDISEYAGYAGLVVANRGLKPNPDSFFAKEYGFQLELTKGEDENWDDVNNGRIGGCATTTDVLAVMGRQFEVMVPAQIAYSRGSDMIVVDRGIGSINQLAGRRVAASQFNESEFFLRYLAQEAGLKVRILRDLDAKPAADEIGLVFYADAFLACDAYAFELAGARRLAGAVGWSPRTDEVVAASNGAAKILVSNRNLLVVADVLVLNKGFATAHPQLVKGLVHGLLHGNQLVRDNPEPHLAVLKDAFGWSAEDARAELKKVHLSNLPENQAFLAGAIDAAGSFAGIYQQAVMAYGSALIPNPADADRFIAPAHLAALAAENRFPGQVVAIAPIRTSSRGALEGEALLSKDIRFFFEPNSATLDASNKANPGFLDTIHRYLQVSPGSVVVLNGHVDDKLKEQFRKDGGEALVRSMALKAVALSKERAQSVRAALLARHPGLDGTRVEAIGRGWEQPVGTDGDLNRRVEVKWYTVE